MRDHTAHLRERISRNLARVEAAKRQAVLHGEEHTKRIAQRHDDLLKEEAALTDQLGADLSSWTQDDLHELEQIQRERRELAPHLR